MNRKDWSSFRRTLGAYDDAELEIFIDLDLRTFLKHNSTVVAAGTRWFAARKASNLFVAKVEDLRLVSAHISARRRIGDETIDIVSVVVKNIKAKVGITLEMSVEQFDVLQSGFFESARAAAEARTRKETARFATRYAAIVQQREKVVVDGGIGATTCIGCEESGALVTLKSCSCEPSWCAACAIKWLIAQNETKIEVDGFVDDSTTRGKCPTCRKLYF